MDQTAKSNVTGASSGASAGGSPLGGTTASGAGVGSASSESGAIGVGYDCFSVVLVAEFCEIEGSKVRYWVGRDHISETVHEEVVPDRWQPVLDSFIGTRLFACHFASTPNYERCEPKKASQTAVMFVDNIEHPDDPSLPPIGAVVVSLSIPDYRARGYVRTVNVAFVESNVSYLKWILPLIVPELRRALAPLSNGAERRFEIELPKAQTALSQAKDILLGSSLSSTPPAEPEQQQPPMEHDSDKGTHMDETPSPGIEFGKSPQDECAYLLSRMTPRHRQELEHELATLTERCRLLPRTSTLVGVVLAHGSLGCDLVKSTASERMSASEILWYLDELLVLRGSRPLRALEDLCTFQEEASVSVVADVLEDLRVVLELYGGIHTHRTPQRELWRNVGGCCTPLVPVGSSSPSKLGGKKRHVGCVLTTRRERMRDEGAFYFSDPGVLLYATRENPVVPEEALEVALAYRSFRGGGSRDPHHPHHLHSSRVGGGGTRYYPELPLLLDHSDRDALTMFSCRMRNTLIPKRGSTQVQCSKLLDIAYNALLGKCFVIAALSSSSKSSPLKLSSPEFDQRLWLFRFIQSWYLDGGHCYPALPNTQLLDVWPTEKRIDLHQLQSQKVIYVQPNSDWKKMCTGIPPHLFVVLDTSFALAGPGSNSGSSGKGYGVSGADKLPPADISFPPLSKGLLLRAAFMQLRVSVLSTDVRQRYWTWALVCSETICEASRGQNLVTVFTAEDACRTLCIDNIYEKDAEIVASLARRMAQSTLPLNSD